MRSFEFQVFEIRFEFFQLRYFYLIKDLFILMLIIENIIQELPEEKSKCMTTYLLLIFKHIFLNKEL
jgi:hypothetical protein